jgi:serine/threonine protein phosphatase PrpC
MSSGPASDAVFMTTAPPDVVRPATSSIVVMPTAINMNWPEQPAGESLVELLLQQPDTQPGAGPLWTALPDLLPALADWHRQGAAVLAPWSLRIIGDTVVTWCAPGFGSTVAWPSQLRRVSSHGPSADLHALGVLLHRLASGHWAVSAEQAVVEAGVLGGEWETGVALTVIACLHPDAGRRARTADDLIEWLAPFLGREMRPSMSATTKLQIADESVTGWTKPRGRPGGDNEDISAWDWTDDGLVAAVLDGVSGIGDGGGRWAARELLRDLRDKWAERTWDPREALAAAVASMPQAPAPYGDTACTLGVVVRVCSERLDWVSFGDCRLYLIRPRLHGMSAVRLSPEHSVNAVALRAGNAPRPEDADTVTNALPWPDRGNWSGSVQLHLGDVILLASDGACALLNDNGTNDWQFNDVLEEFLRAPEHPNAALLVSQLCRRSEELGGVDNATALAVVCGPISDTVLSRSASRRPTVMNEPLMRSD